MDWILALIFGKTTLDFFGISGGSGLIEVVPVDGAFAVLIEPGEYLMNGFRMYIETGCYYLDPENGELIPVIVNHAAGAIESLQRGM